MIGQTIEVSHGGAYSLSYTANSGCTSTAHIQAPHNPAKALWVVPSGCYTACDSDYLLGPLGIYDNYNWQINSTTTQVGSNMWVQNQSIHSGGSYQLLIKVEDCIFESNTPDIILDIKDCPPNSCEFKFDFKIKGIIEGGIIYILTIYNPAPNTQAVHLNSNNGFGTFVPSTLILNPGNNSFEVYFYVNGTYYPGAMDMFVVSGDHCADMQRIELPIITRNIGINDPHFILPSQNTNKSEPLSVEGFNEQTIYIHPNPTSGIVNIISEEKLYAYTVYDMQGSKMYSSIFNGQNQINLQNQSDGMYFINITTIKGNSFSIKVIKN